MGYISNNFPRDAQEAIWALARMQSEEQRNMNLPENAFERGYFGGYGWNLEHTERNIDGRDMMTHHIKCFGCGAREVIHHTGKEELSGIKRCQQCAGREKERLNMAAQQDTKAAFANGAQGITVDKYLRIANSVKGISSTLSNAIGMMTTVSSEPKPHRIDISGFQTPIQPSFWSQVKVLLGISKPVDYIGKLNEWFDTQLPKTEI